MNEPLPPLAALHAELLAFLHRRTGCVHTAQDLAQESLLRGMDVAGKAPVLHWRGLLYRIARNLVADLGRRSVEWVPLEEHEGHAALAAAASCQPEVVVAARQELRLIEQALAGLPPRCRQAVELVRFEGLSYREAAQHMGVSVNMVEKHLIHAMRALGQAQNRPSQ